MADIDVKMPDMAKRGKQPPGEGKPPGGRKPGRPQGRKPSFTVFARINPAYGAALEEYIENAKPKPKINAVIELAIEEFLSSRGLLPPADEDGD